MATTLPPLPRELQLEVTGACNLRCQMCLVRYRPPLNKIEGSMSFELFKDLVDSLPELEVITLQGLGEPLLAPDLFAMIEYAANRGIRMGFNTNGTLLTRERGEWLITAGLDWLHVSIDGATASTYEAIRDRSDFQRVCRNVSGLVDAKRSLAATNPVVSVVFVAMKKNLRELPALVRLIHRLGVDKLWVQNLSHSFGDTDPAGDYLEIRNFTAREALWPLSTIETERWFGEARAVAGELGVELRLPKVEPPESEHREVGTPGCDWPWRAAYVTHEGKVQPCCMIMGADRAVMGDLSNESFPSVWHSDGYAAFRSGLLSDEPPGVCRGCSAYKGVF